MLATQNTGQGGVIAKDFPDYFLDIESGEDVTVQSSGIVMLAFQLSGDSDSSTSGPRVLVADS
jgi:hypothetical protein